MTPRSIAPVPTSGGPAPSTSTPPAAPTGPRPSAPTTGWSWVDCSTNPASRGGSSPSPAGSTSGSRSCRPGPRASSRSTPSARWPWPCSASRPGSSPASMVRPLVLPEDGSPRVEILTRLRHDARLFALPPKERPKGKRGPMPVWGKKLPPPRQGGRWAGPWHVGLAFVYGRIRSIRWKEVICLWHVLGHEVPVKALVASVEGFKKRFTLVSSAVELTGLQMVELFAARFRQEDGFRDLKQRLGWEECRAWTKNPIERTSQAQWVTLSLLRLAQFRLETAGEVDWWFLPPWNKDKDRPSVLDLERLMRRHRGEIQRFLSDWLGTEEEAA